MGMSVPKAAGSLVVIALLGECVSGARISRGPVGQSVLSTGMRQIIASHNASGKPSQAEGNTKSAAGRRYLNGFC